MPPLPRTLVLAALPPVHLGLRPWGGPLAWRGVALGAALCLGAGRAGATTLTSASLPAGLAPPAAEAPLRPGRLQLLPDAQGGLSVSTPGNQSVSISAQRLFSRVADETRAEGEVELRRAGLRLTADTLRYLEASQHVVAQGHVQLEREGDRYSGTEAQVWLNDKRGFVMSPSYHFAHTGAGGTAGRIDFLGPQQLRAQSANYSSCTRSAGAAPDWELRMDRLELDFENNEGRAQGAVLRFLDVPILALPLLSFPATSAPKSGWLPPTINLDSRGGGEIQEPYYFHLAPNYDLTLTPSISTRRGAGLRGEFRHLWPQDAGAVTLHLQPEDRVAGRERHSLHVAHLGRLGDEGSPWRYEVNWQDASDDDYWKDFSRQLPSLTPRLLPQDLQLARQWGGDALDAGDTGASRLRLQARAQRWRVLQGTETILSPYDRVPQLTLDWQGQAALGVHYKLALEGSRFQLRDRSGGDTRPDGERLLSQISLARPIELGWGWLNPRLSWSGTRYTTDTELSDGRRSAWRSLPSFSLDAGLRMERMAHWFGQERLQTLEPRLHFVNTPRRDQSILPMFDTAASDFNTTSIYADNAFTGVDRISDARQITLGATSRILDPATGEEALRFGAAQRYQVRQQQLTVDGTPSTRQLSDLLLFGAGSPWRHWRLDTTVQYNTDAGQAVRAIVSARYQPLPHHTLAASYRYAKGLSEQMEVGWQWPVYRSETARNGQACGGSLYAVGRVNYSVKDQRVTDSLYGMEYDAGCWILRVVVQRESTAANESNLRRMLQLELIGLSRLGSNPLQVLKDNIPGYRLLRDEGSVPGATPSTVNP